MKSAKEDLEKTLQEFGTRLYQSATPNAGANPGNNSGANASNNNNNDNETVDAEFSDK